MNRFSDFEANQQVSTPRTGPAMNKEQAREKEIYSLNCDLCGMVFDSTIAFPVPQVCDACKIRLEALGYRLQPLDVEKLVPLTEINGKDVPKAVADLKSANMPTLFSYRHAYFIGANAEFENTKQQIKDWRGK